MRAKFKVDSVAHQIGGSGEVSRVEFSASGVHGYPGTHPRYNEEDARFHSFIPVGVLSWVVEGPPMPGSLNPGDKFYLDFTKAED